MRISAFQLFSFSAFLLPLFSFSAFSAPAPLTGTNLKLTTVPVQSTASSIGRLLALDATGLGQSITAGVMWDAIVLDGVATADITGLDSALSGKQPLDADLTSIAALTTTTYGRSLLTTADVSALKTALSLGTSDISGLDSALSGKQPLDGDLTSIAALTTTTYGRSLLTHADAAATKTALSLGNVENTALSTWAGSSAITTLGTVTSGTFSGTLGAISGSALTNLNGSNISSGTVPTARLATSLGGDESADNGLIPLYRSNGELYMSGWRVTDANGYLSATTACQFSRKDAGWTDPGLLNWPTDIGDGDTGEIATRAWATANLGGGSGSVTSVGASFTGGLISVAGSPVTTSGTLALTVAGTSGGIPYFSGASTWASSAALGANQVVVGGGAGAAPVSRSQFTVSSTGMVAISPATLADGTSGITYAATMPTTTTAQNNGALFNITTAGSSAFAQNGLTVNLLAGYTGSGGSTAAIQGVNSVAGTKASVTGGDGNIGVFGNSNSTTTGFNFGAYTQCANGATNVANIGKAVTAKNSGTNIGMAGFALNTGTSPIQIGGYFGLQNSDPAFASAALMCDNGSTTSNIFVARDNGTAVLTVADGGLITITGSMAVPKTITAAGTTGARTIDKMSGSVNFAAGATSLVITNNLVTANSVVVATVGANDATMFAVKAVAGSGTITLYPNAAPTGETRVNFLVTN